MLTIKRFERVLKNLPQTFNLKPLTSKALRGVFTVLNYQNKPSNQGFKISAGFLAIIAFLFINPNIGAQTTFVEKVLPAQPKAFVVVTDAVGSEQVPDFNQPLQGYISTYFSRWHQGIDIPSPYGASVKPIADGEVVFAGWSILGYGNLVTVRHEGGFTSLYAHLSSVDVKLGGKVSGESVLGKVGATGVATGSHLHLEVHFYGQPINPLTYIGSDKIVGN